MAGGVTIGRDFTRLVRKDSAAALGARSIGRRARPGTWRRGNDKRPQAVRASQPRRARKCVALDFSLPRLRFASRLALRSRKAPRNRARPRRRGPPRRRAWQTSGGASRNRPSARLTRRLAPVTPPRQAWPTAAVVPPPRKIRPRRHRRSGLARALHPALPMIRAARAHRRDDRRSRRSFFFEKKNDFLATAPAHQSTPAHSDSPARSPYHIPAQQNTARSALPSHRAVSSGNPHPPPAHTKSG